MSHSISWSKTCWVYELVYKCQSKNVVAPFKVLSLSYALWRLFVVQFSLFVDARAECERQSEGIRKTLTVIIVMPVIWSTLPRVKK